MSVKVGINGFGRIGRLAVREAAFRDDIEIVAINNTVTPDYIVYKLKYDSVHGIFPGELSFDDNAIYVCGKRIVTFREKEPQDIDWASTGAEYIIESTGKFTTAEKCMGHFNSPSVKRVIISAPAKDDSPMFVMGVNNQEYDPATMKVISNASCTTNCLAPLAKVLNDNFGIRMGLMTTIHSTTASQKTVDGTSRKDWRGGRAAEGDVIPPSLRGAAKGSGPRDPRARREAHRHELPGSVSNIIGLERRLKQTPTSKKPKQRTQKHTKTTKARAKGKRKIFKNANKIQKFLYFCIFVFLHTQ